MLIVSTGGRPERLVLAFGLGVGRIAGVKTWKWTQTVPTSHNIYLLWAYRLARLLFGTLYAVCIWLPEWTFLPAFGEPHAMELIGAKEAQKLEETFTPRCLGCNAFQQIAQDRENAEHVVRPHVEGLVPLWILRPLGNDWSCADTPVPEAAMVRANITNRVYSYKPRFQHARAHAQVICELVPDSRWCSVEEPEHGAEVHQVDEYPVRRKLVLIAIGLFKVDGEGLT